MSAAEPSQSAHHLRPQPCKAHPERLCLPRYRLGRSWGGPRFGDASQDCGNKLGPPGRRAWRAGRGRTALQLLARPALARSSSALRWRPPRLIALEGSEGCLPPALPFPGRGGNHMTFGGAPPPLRGGSSLALATRLSFRSKTAKHTLGRGRRRPAGHSGFATPTPCSNTGAGRGEAYRSRVIARGEGGGAAARQGEALCVFCAFSQDRFATRRGEGFHTPGSKSPRRR